MSPVTLLALCLGVLVVSAWCARAARLAEAAVFFLVAVVATFALRIFEVDTFIWVDAIRPYLLSVLLPLIVFETAYCVDARNRRHLMPAGLLVVGALLITPWCTATLLRLLGAESDGVTVALAVVFALVLLPTDATPVAPILRLRAPRGMRMLLRNELPFGAALATTGIVAALPHVGSDPNNVGWTTLVVDFAPAVAIGAAVGSILALAAAMPLRRLTGGTLVHWAGAATAVLAYQVTEALAGAGIVAVLMTGILLGRETAAPVATDLWRPIGRGASGLVMLAFGAAICSLPLDFHAPVFVPVVVGMLLGRTVAVVIVEQSTHRWVKFGITMREMLMISGFGIRGAPTIALALALPDTLPHVDTVRTAAFAVVAFDLLITTSLTPWLARRFSNHALISPALERPVNIPY